MNLAELSVRRPVFTTVMIMVLLVFGLFSYGNIGVDQFPEIEIPVVAVTTIYPGADPSTIESKVIDPLEEAINGINGIDELRSTSVESAGIITIRFKLEKDADVATQEVRDKVQAVLSKLPSDLEQPVVQKFDIGAAPIIGLVVSGPSDPRETTRIAEDVIKQRLQTLNGVGNITLVGGQTRQFQVRVDPYALDSFGLAVGDITQALRAQNIEVPGGRITQGDTEFALKTMGQLTDVEGIKALTVSNAQGRTVHISDVAEVLDSSEEKRSHASLNGAAAVSLTVQKQSGANTVAVAHAVKDEVEKLRKELGSSVTIEIPTDNSEFIEHSIKDVQFDLLFGAVLAIIIILLFLRDWRATLISALALPTSIVATFAFISVMHFTFNTMTMLALTLSIGILIDDAIVVIENIHRHLEMGKSAREATVDATTEIGFAVLAITLSLVAVFVPVATMKGILGRFFFQFGMTVAFAVSVSLFVAFTLTPMLSARLLKLNHNPGMVSRAIERALKTIDSIYESIARAALRHQAITMAVAIASFIGALFIGKQVAFEFIPKQDRGEFTVLAEMPTGTSLEKTIEVTEKITAELREVPGVSMTFTTIGGGSQGEVNSANVHVELVERKERAFSQQEVMRYIRERLARYENVKIAVEVIPDVGGGNGSRAPEMQYVLQGPDLEKLNQTADTIIAKLQKMPGFVDVDKSSRTGKPELHLTIDRQRAADLGVPVASVAMAIRTLYAGEEASEVATDGDRFPIEVRMTEAMRADPERIMTLQVRSMTGSMVPLSSLVRVEYSSGPAKIERFKRQRQITVMANLDGLALGTATTQIQQVAAESMQDGVQAALTGSASTLKESVGYMLEAVLLALILVFLIMAAQFESFVHPFTIMLSVPLSFIGAFLALLLLHMNMSIFTMIGFIMLMGLVTKNALLLVDYANQQREAGMSRFEALVTAGTVRLRPILMTTAAMVGGMMPVALATGAGAEQRSPMAVAIIGGLITSTMLTLVVVPVAYDIIDRMLGFVKRLFGMDKPAAETAHEEHVPPYDGSAA
jgi:hydrophobic/amphiphilic exporter-1 (mainly G- bacteria), HAE1 family